MLSDDHDGFWRFTPRLLILAIKGKAQARRQDHTERMRQAWWTAAMPLMKRFPKLSDVTGDKPVNAQPAQTGAEIERAGLRWHYALNARKGPPPK